MPESFQTYLAPRHETRPGTIMKPRWRADGGRRRVATGMS
jgi:hypothetical protein